MAIKPICTESDYAAALREISLLMDRESDLTPAEADHFEVLALVIEAYEAKQYPILPPDPIEAIKFRMEQANLTAKDLEPMIGRLNCVYEVLARRRPLTLPMIRRLHDGLGIPLETLIAHAA